MDDKLKLLKTELGEARLKFDETLRYHTHSQLPRKAQAFYIATTQKELIKALQCAYELQIPYFVFGGGSKLPIINNDIPGLTIKNRTSVIKIGSIKGKVGRDGLGIDEALIEVDSGVSLSAINEYLNSQHLKMLNAISFSLSTIGSAIFLDQHLQTAAQQAKVWIQGEIEDIPISQLQRQKHVVLSVIFKVKAR